MVLRRCTLISLCTLAVWAVEYDCSAGGKCSINLDDVAPPQQLTLPVHLEAVAATSFFNGNEWHFAVENVYDRLVSGKTTLLFMQDPTTEALKPRFLQALQYLADNPDAKWSIVSCHAPLNPFVRVSSYFWEVTTASREWVKKQGPGLPPIVAVSLNAAPLGNTDALPFNVRAITNSEEELQHLLSGDPKFALKPAKKVHDKAPMKPCANPNKLLWYIYPDDGVTGSLSATQAQVLENFRNSPQYTSNPAEACLFLVPFDTTPLSPLVRGIMSDFGPDGSKLEAQLRALPYWNGGRNHILLDMTDSRSPWFDPGNAVLWKSGYDRFQYRDWLDVSFPLLPNKFCTNDFVRRSTERPILLSFKGTQWSEDLGVAPFDVRRRAASLHNGNDIIIVSSGDSQYDYEDLLAQSVFCLIQRGGGLHSYRFLEALSFGCIPVILSDDWVIPFAEAADPRAYTIMVPERRWSDIPGILRNMSTPVVAQMHASAVEVYEQLFRNPLQTAMQITVSRLVSASSNKKK